jgi:kynurenine formamidase
MKSKVVDITLSLQDSLPGFEKQVVKSMDEDGWNATELKIYSHAGTHMDAPLHFNAGIGTIDKIDPERFVCDCHIIRLPETEESEILTIHSLGEKVESIKESEGIIFNTGWSNFISDPEKYRNRLPRIGRELAEFLVDKKVNLIGVEPPSIAKINDLEEIQEIHKILLAADILILEGICNLHKVQNDFVKLIALPLKIKDGDGAPVRAIILDE